MAAAEQKTATGEEKKVQMQYLDVSEIKAKELTVSDLEPGDVLLFRGNELLCRTTHWFDKSFTNHGALYVGRAEDFFPLTEEEKKAGLGSEQHILMEAVGKGLVMVPLAKSTSLVSDDLAVVRRLRTKIEAQKDDSKTPVPMNPVIETGRRYYLKKEQYAISHMVFLFVLLPARKLTEKSKFGRLVRTVTDMFFEGVLRIMHPCKEPMICSEFVFRCYNEAVPQIGDPYAISVFDVAPGSGESDAGLFGGIKKRTRAISGNVKAYLAETGETSHVCVKWRKGRKAKHIHHMHSHEATGRTLQGERHHVTEEELKDVLLGVSDFVTPGDLERCDDLVTVGILRWNKPNA